MATEVWRRLTSFFDIDQEEPGAPHAEEGTPEPVEHHDSGSGEVETDIAMAPKSGKTSTLKIPTTQRQRQLPGQKLSRADPCFDYEVPTSPPLRPASAKHQDFSPRKGRNEGKAARVESATSDQATEHTLRRTAAKKSEASRAEQGSAEEQPRRSPRKKHALEDTESAPSSPGKVRKKTKSTSGPTIANGDMEDDGEGGLFMSDDEQLANIEVTTPTTAPASTQASGSTGRKRGRPPKSKMADESPATSAAPGTKATASSQPGRRQSKRVQDLAANEPTEQPGAADGTRTLPQAKAKRIPKTKQRVMEQDQNQEDQVLATEKIPLKAPRLSQVRFAGPEGGRDKPAEENEESGDETESQAPQARSKRSENVARPASSAAQSDADKYGYLFEKWPELEDLLRSKRKIGVNKDGEKSDFALTDHHVTKMIERCMRLKSQLTKMSAAAQSEDEIPDASAEFKGLREGIEVLCGTREDTNKPVNFNDESTADNIYFHLFPKLIDLLCYIVSCFEMTDEGNAMPALGISAANAETVVGYVGDMIRLEKGARKYPAPDPSLCVVKSVRSGIVPKLRELASALNKSISQNEDLLWHRTQQARRAQLAAQREAEEHAEALQRAERARWEKLEEEWAKLHDARIHWEGCVTATLAKRRYLSLPEPELDLDFNGEEFERVEMFRPRVGPTRAAIAKVMDTSRLPPEAFVALTEGLERFAGDPKIFWQIFAHYCGPPSGPLRPYTVTEIVVWAADIKAALMEEDVDEEDWVLLIPDWTKPQSLLDD